MSYVTLGPYVAKRPWLFKILKPVSEWYTNAAGYRQLGLLYVLRSHRPSLPYSKFNALFESLRPSGAPSSC